MSDAYTLMIPDGTVMCSLAGLDAELEETADEMW